MFAALHLSGILAPLEEPWYDGLARLFSSVSPSPPRVLVVEASAAELSPPRLAEMIDRLAALKPAGIAVTEAPQGLLQGSDGLPETAVPLVFGMRPMVDPVDSSKLVLRHEVDRRLEGRVGWTLAGRPGTAAVHRCQLRSLTVEQRSLPTLEWLIASQAGSALPPPEVMGSDCFRIRFRGPSGSLPTVSAERVLGGGLVEELVAGRWVLVGPPSRDPEARLATPMSRRAGRLSLLEFQGQALETLLAGEVVRRPGAVWTCLLFLLVALGFAWALDQVAERWLYWLLLAFIVPLAAVSVMAFALADLWLPAPAILLLLVAMLGWTLDKRLRSSRSTVRGLASGLLGKLKSRLSPDGFYLAEDPWPQIVEFLEQALSIERQIFLEPVAGTERVREICSSRCSLEDIDERRRDIGREPFSEVLRRSRPLRLERPFLCATDEPEVQFLVPFSFGGELLGFWALGVSPSQAVGNFERLIGDFAEQIAEILYHRSRIRPNLVADQPLDGGAGFGESYRSLQWVSTMLERRLFRMERLLRGLSSSVVVYDLFGRVLDVTHSMLERLSREGLAPYELSAHGMIKRLARCSTEEARGYLRQVVTERRSVTLPVFFSDSERSSALLVLSPIRSGRAEGPLDQPSAFGVYGLALELLETSSLEALNEVKGQLGERLGQQVIRDLGEIRAALLVLRDGDRGWQLRQQVLDLIDSKMSSLGNAVDECREYLSIGLEELDQTRYPVDARDHLERVVQERRSEAARREVKIETSLPDHLGQVLSSPEALERGFHSILDFLLDDAEAGEPLWIRVEEEPERTVIQFSNRGSGFVQDTLDDILCGSGEEGDERSREMSELCERVELWGGLLVGTSHVGVGTRLEMSLRRLQHL